MTSIYWLWHVRGADIVSIGARVHAHVYTQNAFRCLRWLDSYWYLEEEHRRTINLGDRRLQGRFRGCTGRRGFGRRRPRSACRMHLHLKWLRLPDTPLRNHVMRDFYCFLPILSFLSGSTAFRYHARQHRILGFHWDPGFLLGSADRGFRLLSVANIPWCKFMRYLKVQALRYRIFRILGQSRTLYMDLVVSSAFKIQDLGLASVIF